MEIIHAIWEALTTENEFLIKITSMPMLVLELTVSMLLFTTLLDIKCTTRQKLTYICILSIIGFINLWFIPTPFNTFVNIIACPLLVFFIFKTNVLKAILAEIIPYIFFFIISSILITFLVRITGLNSDYFLNVLLYKMCFSLNMYLLTFLFYLVFKKFKINITLFDKMKKEHNYIIFINLLIRNYSYCFTIMYIYNIYKQITNYNNAI